MPCSAQKMLGALDKVIFEKTYEQEVDPELLGEIWLGHVRLHISKDAKWDVLAKVAKYDAKTNTLELIGSMGSGTRKYMNKLKEIGWVLDEAAAKQHSLPITSREEAEWEKCLV